jgi:predicted dehydrogenase
MKIGIIGGYGHESVKLLPGVRLARACDDFDQQALVRAKAEGNQQSYPSMDSLLEDFCPDLVYIGSAYALNGALAIRALERGFDVVCEKPLAVDFAVFKTLCHLTASGRRRLIGEFTMRWMEPFQRARQLIKSGAIGAPVIIQAQKTYKFGAHRPEFYKTRRFFGGILPWVASHAMDFAAWCTGLHYESVTAAHGNRCSPGFPEMEDHAIMQFQMTGGVPCLITSDFLRPLGASSHSDDRLRVTGSEGVLEIRNREVFLCDAHKEYRWNCESGHPSGGELAGLLVRAALGHPGSEITTHECLHVTAAAMAARESADHEGRLSRVSEFPDAQDSAL